VTNQTGVEARVIVLWTQDGLTADVTDTPALAVPASLLNGQWWCWSVTVPTNGLGQAIGSLAVGLESVGGNPLASPTNSVSVNTNAPATNSTSGGPVFTMPTGTNQATGGDLAQVVRAGAQQAGDIASAVNNLAAEGRDGARSNYTLPAWSTNHLSDAAKAAAGEVLEAGQALAGATTPSGWSGGAGDASWWRWTIIPAGNAARPAGFVLEAYPPTLLAAIWGYLPWLKIFLGIALGVVIFERALIQLGAALNEANPPGIQIPNMSITIAGFGGNAAGVLWALVRAGLVGFNIGAVLLGGAALSAYAVVAGLTAFAASLAIPSWLAQPFWFVSQIVPVEVLIFGFVATVVLYGVRMTGLATGVILRLMPT